MYQIRNVILEDPKLIQERGEPIGERGPKGPAGNLGLPGQDGNRGKSGEYDFSLLDEETCRWFPFNTISREMKCPYNFVLTGSNDGIVMLWHLSKDGNNNATISNRPYQILRGHTDSITSGSINKTCQTAVTTSGERLVLIHRIEEAPPNGQHELLGDLPLIEIKFDEMSFSSSLSSITVHNCIVTAAGVIVCIMNLTTLIAYDINGLEIMRKETKADHGNCQQIMVVERTSRGNVIVTGGGNTVCFWSARTLGLLHS